MAAIAQHGLEYNQGLLTAGATIAVFGLGVALLAQLRIVMRRASKSVLARSDRLDQAALGIRNSRKRLLAKYALGDKDAMVRMERMTQLLGLVAMVLGVALGGFAFVT